MTPLYRASTGCRGFGRVIEIDYRLVIPDRSKSIDEGAIRAFQGEVYSESLRDLQRAAKKHKIRTNIPWSKLNKKELKFVMEGEPGYKPDANKWYGVHRFFDWLNGNLSWCPIQTSSCPLPLPFAKGAVPP